MTIPSNYPRRLVSISSIFTCAYTSLLLFILMYYKSMYNMGNRSFLPFVVILTFAEFFKLTFAPYTPEKSPKSKKYNFKNQLKGVSIILSMIVVYYITAVFFGAPFMSEQEETLMFSLLLTSITVVPICLNFGPDVAISVLTGIAMYHGDSGTETMKRSIYLTLFGAWLGAIVIPLDWDRPWQVWPIPCSLGALLGFIFSHMIISIKYLLSLTNLFVKKCGKQGFRNV